jgi:hypothetical protein
LKAETFDRSRFQRFDFLSFSRVPVPADLQEILNKAKMNRGILSVRVFCFSFVVYLVLLLTQPCQDLAAMVNDCADNNAHVAHLERTSDTEPPGPDECSPFCVCSCCSLSVVNHTVPVGVMTKAENVTIPSTLIEYTNPYTKAHQNSIWQPPKA